MRKYGSQMNNQQLNYILEKIDKYFVNYRKKYSAKPTIIYHGSEPLMVKKILFYSIEGLSNKFHFGIQTNASLLEKKDVDFLKSHKVSIGISLDSSNPEINNLTRRTSDFKSFNGTIQALDWFGDYKGLSVITTVTKYGLNPSVCNLRLD
jgi:uncharacterized protein